MIPEHLRISVSGITDMKTCSVETTVFCSLFRNCVTPALYTGTHITSKSIITTLRKDTAAKLNQQKIPTETANGSDQCSSLHIIYCRKSLKNIQLIENH